MEAQGVTDRPEAYFRVEVFRPVVVVSDDEGEVVISRARELAAARPASGHSHDHVPLAPWKTSSTHAVRL